MSDSEELRLLRQELHDLEDRAGYNNQALSDDERATRMADVKEHMELVKAHMRGVGPENAAAFTESASKPIVWSGTALSWGEWILQAHRGGHLPEATGWAGGELKVLELAATAFCLEEPVKAKPASTILQSQKRLQRSPQIACPAAFVSKGRADTRKSEVEMTKMPKQLQASELTPNIHAKGIGFPLGVSWKAFRIPDEWLEEVESDYGGILVAVLPGRTRLLETFAKREERDRAELSGMLLEWAIQQLVTAGSWPELVRKSGQETGFPNGRGRRRVHK